MASAMRRLTANRFPDNPELHELYQENQITNSSCLAPLERHFHMLLKDKLSTISYDADEWRNIWCDKTHEKRKERQHARQLSYNSGRTRTTYINGHTVYTYKDLEILAWGKYLRGIGSLGSLAAARVGYFVDVLKECMSEGIAINNHFAEFVANPEVEDLTRILVYLELNMLDTYFIAFSDDSCLSVTTDHGHFVLEMDIEKCDNSVGPGIFGSLARTMTCDSRYDKDIYRANLALYKKMVVFSPEHKGRVKSRPRVTLIPQTMKLVSGSPLTTGVDTWSNFGIWFRFINYVYRRDMTQNEVLLGIKEAARQMGFSVKVFLRSSQTNTFLKHFLCKNVNEQPEAILAIGTLLRGLGCADGDLPPGGTLVNRCERRLHEIVSGYKHDGDHIITYALRKRWVNVEKFGKYIPKVDFHSWKTTNNNNFKRCHIPTEEIAKRYGCRVAELEELAELILHSNVGDFISHPVLDTIFRQDYGYVPACHDNRPVNENWHPH